MSNVYLFPIHPQFARALGIRAILATPSAEKIEADRQLRRQQRDEERDRLYADLEATDYFKEH